VPSVLVCKCSTVQYSTVQYSTVQYSTGTVQWAQAKARVTTPSQIRTAAPQSFVEKRQHAGLKAHRWAKRCSAARLTPCAWARIWSGLQRPNCLSKFLVPVAAKHTHGAQIKTVVEPQPLSQSKLTRDFWCAVAEDCRTNSVEKQMRCRCTDEGRTEYGLRTRGIQNRPYRTE
jgi:hypothetical protein